MENEVIVMDEAEDFIEKLPMKFQAKTYWTLKDIIEKKMGDKEFREAFDEYEKEFQIARKIAQLRKKSGMTQSELAKRANTSQSAIDRLESGGHHNITLAFLTKVCNAMNIAPEIRFKKIGA